MAPISFALINFLAAGLLTMGLNWLAAIPWRKAAARHWTEQARLLWPVRVSAGINIWTIPVCLSVLEAGPDFATWIIPLLSGVAGAILATFPLDREILPRLSFAGWLRLVVRAWIGRVLLLGVIVAGSLLMPDEFSGVTIIIGGTVFCYLLALQFGLYVRLLRWMRVLQAPDDRLREMVARTALSMGVREPRVWLLDAPLALAFALPITRELMFSRRLLEILSEDEASSICAHELAHLTESKLALAGRIAGSMALYPVIFIGLASNTGFPWIFVIIGMELGLAMLALKIGRRMEKRADRMAAENQAAEGIYASALEKLYRDSLVPAVSASNRRVHPHLYDRMLAAGIQPSYPRPAKPGKMAWPAYLVLGLLGAIFGMVVARSE